MAADTGVHGDVGTQPVKIGVRVCFVVGAWIEGDKYIFMDSSIQYIG